MPFAQRLLPMFCVSLLACGLAGCGASSVPSRQVAALADSTRAKQSSVASSTAAPSTKGSPTDSTKSPSAKSPPVEPLRYTVRKAVTPPAAPAIPRVLLSARHAELCKVNVGSPFPATSLPRLGGQPTELTSLLGKQATVVLFWHPDRWMARTALTDMQRDIADQFDAQQVAVVGIAVRQPQGAVQAALNQAQASFPQLVDADGQAFAAVGTSALPRIYVLDPSGKIAWFDIEYSEGTRRELWQTLHVLTK